jgi:hypothetical protein
VSRDRAADPLAYDASQGPITDPGPAAEALSSLPDDLPGLARVVQGLVFDYFADEAIFGWRPPRERIVEIGTRHASAMLARLAALDARPLTEPRPPERRLVGCCRNFTVLLCTLARARGIPVRARVGFARYFSPGFHVDHEILEWGDAGRRRWRLADPQLSERRLTHYRIGFDPLGVPRDQFLVGGCAWQLCRSGAGDPEPFGLAPELPQPRGLSFVRSHVVQDRAALNKMEPLLWDVWGLMQAELDAELALLDEVAERTQEADGFADARRLYGTPGRAGPSRVRCLSPVVSPHEVTLDLDAAAAMGAPGVAW